MARKKKVISIEEVREEQREDDATLTFELSGKAISCGRCGIREAVIGIARPDLASRVWHGYHLWVLVGTCAECIKLWEEDGQATVLPFPHEEA